jgi:DhnA family fructose-bisphosphate aldolase class Ia
MSTADERPLHIQQAEGLRAAAAMIEANPELAEILNQAFRYMSSYVMTVDEVATFVRAGARHGAEIVKDYPADDDSERHFRAYAKFGPIELAVHTERKTVCERVVTGTETVTKQVPDPAAPLVEVTEEVEKVEWVCRPLLAAEQTAVTP